MIGASEFTRVFIKTIINEYRTRTIIKKRPTYLGKLDNSTVKDDLS